MPSAGRSAGRTALVRIDPSASAVEAAFPGSMATAA